jgi:hypothetical protein
MLNHPIRKKIIIEAGTMRKDMYLCLAALNHYLSHHESDESTDRERTYYTKDRRKQIRLRERGKCIHLQQADVGPKKINRGIVLC